ncbi:MAG: N,N-dimethylformamidase beta subunit family domain-containing protein, partial [Alphaproteobacteria bacterium]
EPPKQNATVRYPHMEWAYSNGYSKKYASAGWASYERNFAVWAESQGYALDIIAGHDLPDHPDLLKAYDCAVFIGHDEYWSWEMRDTVDAYVEGGGKAARFAGNLMWQTRLEDGGATQICHKYNARQTDPLRDTELSTTSWEAPEVGRPGALTFGLNASQGVYTRYGFCCPRAPGGFTVYRPEHWAFDGSDLYYGDVFGGESTIFGYEVDGLDYTVRHGLPYPTGEDGAPDSIDILAMGLATLVEDHHGHEGVEQYLGDWDARFIAETMHGEATPETIDRVKRGSGMMVTMAKGRCEVFHAGTTNWVAGLIDHDPFVERITRNVLDRYLCS